MWEWDSRAILAPLWFWVCWCPTRWRNFTISQDCKIQWLGHSHHSPPYSRRLLLANSPPISANDFEEWPILREFRRSIPREEQQVLLKVQLHQQQQLPHQRILEYSHFLEKDRGIMARFLLPSITRIWEDILSLPKVNCYELWVATSSPLSFRMGSIGHTAGWEGSSTTCWVWTSCPS